MTTTTDEQTAALALLRGTSQRLSEAKAKRKQVAIFARETGLTYAAIGEALGITETGARMLIERQREN